MIRLSAQEELQTLIEETTSALGATDQTYIRFLKLLQTEGKLSVPNRVMQGQLLFFKYQPISESFIASNKYYDKYQLSDGTLSRINPSISEIKSQYKSREESIY